MKYEGVHFVEFLRRLIDFPRRKVIDALNPFFFDLVNVKVAETCGAKIHLATDVMFCLEKPTLRKEHTPTRSYTRKFNIAAHGKNQRPVYAKKSQAQGKSPFQRRSSETNSSKPKLGPEKTPLKGATAMTYLTTLNEGIDSIPPHKWEAEKCCYCWN